ncbi:MAG: hypothetical protein HY512_02940 [Candidatus Aenigmarchaeota archaeon]|nr:hypothetical protein [Candidatus Aenigmarchaeota archaeon]
MKAYIATNFIGVFAFDGNKNTLTYVLFQKNPLEVAKKLKESGLLEEEKKVIEDLKNSNYKEVVLEKTATVEGINCIQEKNHIGVKVLNDQFRKLALDLGFAPNQQDLNQFLSKVNIEINKLQLQKPKKDRIIMSVIGVIDELDKSTNTFTERLKEWYGFHSPEIVRAIQSNEKFVELISKYGHRDNVKDEKIKTKSFSGADLGKEDVEALQNLASNLVNCYNLRENLAKYLEKITKETIPNLSAIAGSLLASRILQLAGGLDKIARMPSSTIQLLGAEKSLFRHLKGQGKAPKYGVLFAHPAIQKAPNDKKGKIARLIAAKLSLAARIDAYSERDDGEKMKKELDDQIKKV